MVNENFVKTNDSYNCGAKPLKEYVDSWAGKSRGVFTVTTEECERYYDCSDVSFLHNEDGTITANLDVITECGVRGQRVFGLVGVTKDQNGNWNGFGEYKHVRVI